MKTPPDSVTDRQLSVCKNLDQAPGYLRNNKYCKCFYETSTDEDGNEKETTTYQLDGEWK